MATVLKNKTEKSYLTGQERWEAVIHREKNADDEVDPIGWTKNRQSLDGVAG